MKQHGSVYIGTSNVVIPGNKKSFPSSFQSKSRLSYYSTLFNSVEINSSFYKTPLQKTFERWANETTDEFRFTIKLTKAITHAKELKGDISLIEKFITAANGIGNKKGCLLIQFPGKITLDYFNEVEQILEELSRHDPDNHWNRAVEFRHASWYTGETWELLNEYTTGLVLQDKPKAKMLEVKGHASFIYLRFHGPKGDYKESYSSSFLYTWAATIKEWMQEGKDVYVYFNNTIGNAFENAKTLTNMLKNEQHSLK